MSEFVMTTRSGSKKRLTSMEDLSNKKITKVKVKADSADSGASQEVEVQTIAPYVKPIIDQTLGLRIHSTIDLNCDWADPFQRIRKSEKSPQPLGEKQIIILEQFMPSIGKESTDDLVEGDHERMKDWVAAGPGGLRFIVAAREEASEQHGDVIVKTTGVEETWMVIYNDKLCLRRPRRPRGYYHDAVCTGTGTGCLRFIGTRLGEDNPKCTSHKGTPKYGVAELRHEADDKVSVYSTSFSFSVPLNCSEEEEEEEERRLGQLALTSAAKGSECSWKIYKDQFPEGEVGYVPYYRKYFDTPREADMELAKLQTACLLAKLANTTIGQNDIVILNREICFALKNEVEMADYLNTEYGVELNCNHLPQANAQLPITMGIASDSRSETPGPGCGRIYTYGDANICYIGKKEETVGTSVTGRRMSESPICQYENETGSKVRNHTHQHGLLINTNELLPQTESICIFSAYLAHLFKLANPKTDTDFVTLNKAVPTKHLIDNWDAINNYSLWYYKHQFVFA